ncbi:hypothetical protein ACFLZB_04315 [Nanoarchaeota archaeon]
MRESTKKLVIVVIVVYALTSLVQFVVIGNLTGFFSSKTTTVVEIPSNWGVPGVKNITFNGSLNSNNFSVDLNWTNLTSPPDYDLYYIVYYSSNISAIMNLDPNNVSPNVSSFSPIYTPYYTDHTADQVQVRYYRVGYVIYDVVQLANGTPVGKFTYYYDAPVSSVYGTLASNRISPYLNLSETAASFLQGVPSYLNPTISRLDKTNNAGEHLTTHVKGFNANNFPLVIGEAYQVTVDDYYNHTVVGNVYLPPYSLNYIVPNSSIFGILASNWYGIYDFKKKYTAESFLQEIPGGLNPTISKLDKSDGAGEHLTTHVQNLSDGNNFTMYPGTGYVITVDQNYTHALCLSNCFN